MEELILRYYLSLFSILFFLIFFSYQIYLIGFKKIIINDFIITVDKGDGSKNIIEKLKKQKILKNKKIYEISFRFYQIFYNIHYGTFLIKKGNSFFNILKIISHSSNIDYRITIVEGWQKYQLRNYLSNFFKNVSNIDYDLILPDTYIIKSDNNFDKFLQHLKNQKNNYLKKYIKNKLLKKYTLKEIMIIASMVEKEAIDDFDKKLVSSVIFNRLNKGMKLQIDATVIYAITNDKQKLERKLLKKDLKFKHPFNTYIINGLPPDLISYVGLKTIEIVLENYNSDFLFYFYDKFKKKHIYSKNYNEHKRKLNDYRKKSK